MKFYQPKAFLMENVPNMMSMGKGIIKDQITQDFENLGYIVHSKILMASDFGVPQNRRRAFFVGFKKECNFEFPTPFATEKITAFEAISDLPDYSLNDGKPNQHNHTNINKINGKKLDKVGRSKKEN